MRVSILIILLFYYQQLYSQHVSSWYNTENGLPQNSVKAIAKDKYGFIWLSTDNGIVGYDGSVFTIYNKLEVTNLHFENFYGNVLNDSIIIYNNNDENKILIRKRKIQSITKNTFSKTFTKEKFNFLKRISKNSPETKYSSNTKYYIKTISGRYSFYNNRIIYTDEKNGQTKVPIAAVDLSTMFLYKEALFLTDPKNRKTYRIYKGKPTVLTKAALFNDPETKIYWQQITGQTFIINKNNIYLLEGYKNDDLQLKFLITYKNFGNQFFNSILYDKDFKRLYLGSVTKGLNIVQLTQFFTAQKKIHFVDEVSSSSLPFNKNTIIDPYGYEVNKYGLVKNHHFGINDKHFMFYDNSGNILYKNDDSVVKRYKSSQYTTSHTIHFPGLHGFFKSENQFAVSTTDLTNSYLHLFENQELKTINATFKFTGLVNSFLQYNNDELLIGCSDGLYLVGLKKKITAQVAKGINVKNIIKTSDGQIWITTNKDGFFLFRDKKLFKMPLDQNLYLNSAHYILGDSHGYYWISSNNGLFRVAKKQLLKYSENNKTPVFYYRFTKNDGLLTAEFNGGSMPEAYSLKNGEFVFPSMEGFVFFDPENIKAYYPDKKRIYVERVRINDSDITYFSKDLILENNYKHADIFIDIPYYSNSYNLRVEAKIEGQNVDWHQIEIKNERKYTISNLNHGNYILQLRVQISPDGSYEYRTVKIKIKPLFYQTTAFKLIVTILLLFIFIAIIYTRTKFLQIRNRLLKKRVSSIKIALKESAQHLEAVKNDMQKESEYQKKLIEAISHDISTPVKFIAMMSQKLIDVHEVDLQKEYFDSIHQSSEELYNFTIHLKEYSDLFGTYDVYEKDEYPINEILITKQKLFNEISKSQNSRIEIIEKSSIYCQFNKSILSCIVHNLVDNAVKNTSDGIINIIVEDNQEKITLKIADTGKGMSQEQLTYYNGLYQMSMNDDIIKFRNYGLGLHMVIYLVKKMYADISFYENYPGGTTVEVNIYKNKMNGKTNFNS
ncbi:sensor histidine kinase [Chryseobacterium lathyri]|uniref:histidine kinase n=1 Tax=Chryseobacterium lathyri TaxID=395933 RepID=A0ABT9SN15_9FLAO|nr:HAMP domain-containing sensor histidine kinase [Chryseobacterium lathyri]MDP9960843.1 signal transduction histidine kinase [Chryseobacterium lathyri]